MIILLALGCIPDPPPGPSSPASWVDSPGAIGAELIGASGARSATARVRAFNVAGGSVLGERAQVDVDGETVEVTVGPQGYGDLLIELPGTHELSLGTSTAWVHVYDSDWPGFGMMGGIAAPMQTEQDAYAAGTGVLTASGDEVWWTGVDQTPHIVLVTDGPVGGIAVGQYDGDGLVDAAVWAGGSIHFLRGRSEGGMTWAGQLRSPTHVVAGMDFGDANSDGIDDLVIAWNGPPEAGLLDVWESDGLLQFTSVVNRKLTLAPFDVAVGDNTGEGRGQITVTVDGGNWERFFRGPVGYSPSGPALELDLQAETRVYSGWDINRDGADELVFASPHIPGGERRIVLFDLNGDVASFTGLSRLDSFLAIDDFDDDGLADLLFSEGGGDLVAVHATPDTEGLQTDTLIRGVAGGGPIARFPGTQTLMVAGDDDWLWVEGRSTPDEWFVTEDPPLISPGLTVRDGLFELRELDGDATATELIGIRAGPSSTHLRVWTIRESGVSELGDVQLDPAEVPLLDLAVCGTDAFVLLEDALYQVDLSNPSALSVSDSVAVVGRRVACGEGPAGPVTVLTDAGAQLYDTGLQQVGITPAAGSEDVFLDDQGTSTCDRVGCRIERGPVGQDGAVVDVIGWPDGAAIAGEIVHGAGVPTVADVDGNGFADVLFHSLGRIVLYRHTGDSLGPAEIFHTRRPISGTLGIADLDQDGFNDAWGVELENFRLRVTSSATVPVAVIDTADTGTPSPPADTGVSAATADTGIN